MSNPKPTVLPVDKSLRRQDNNLGAPGIQLPKHPEEIKEFKQVRDVDARELNERLKENKP